MLSINNSKKVLFIVLLLIFVFLLYFIIPYKIILSPRVSQLAFVYDNEDIIDIKEQVSYTLGSVVSTTAKVENDTGNTTLFVNKFVLINWLIRCKKNCSYIDSDGIKTDNAYIKVECSKEDVPRKMIDAEEFIRYYFVKQLLYGVKPEKIKVKIQFIEQTTGNILISAEWPKEEYNVDREQFFK